MELTTVARVKAHLGTQQADTADDGELGILVAVVSGDMEEAMHRAGALMLQERVEVVSVDAGMGLATLRAAPVSSLSQLLLSPTRDFSSAQALVANTDFVLEEDLGLIRFLGQLVPAQSLEGRPLAPVYVQATYTGGWSTDADKLAGLHADVVEAATLQVAHLWKRRSNPGAELLAPQGGGLQFGTPEYQLLAHVRAVCQRHKRRRF